MKTFYRLDMMSVFYWPARRVHGIKVRHDCVVGPRFNFNAIHIKGPEIGTVFWVGKRARVRFIKKVT